MTEIAVGSATAAPGEIATGRIEVTAMAGGAPLGIPVIVMKPMSAGDTIARIFDVYGEEVGKISALADGMFFGLRCLPSVMTGDWCCFYAKLDGTRDD